MDVETEIQNAEREGYLKGLRRAVEIVEANGKPGPGGVNITNGIPAEIYIGIGRGHYEDENGEYELAQDTADSVRGTIAVCIQREAAALRTQPAEAPEGA